MNPRMLQQMMKQLGITVEELDDVQRVVIETPTKDIVFTTPAVSAMKSQGQTTYQVQGEPQVMAKGQAQAKATDAPTPAEVGAPEPKGPLFSEDDVAMVMQAAAVNREQARKALEEADGEVATAIVRLTEG